MEVVPQRHPLEAEEPPEAIGARENFGVPHDAAGDRGR
jgi:hypothetical protein